MELERVTLVLENCDCITIEGKHIEKFSVEDIKMSIRKTSVNSIKKTDTVHHFAIKIDKNANVDRYPFEQEYEDMKEKTFDRLLEYNDITQIEFNLIADTNKNRREHYHYYLTWKSEDENNNPAQKSRLDKDGNLYILVDESMKLDDYFYI